MSWQSTPLSGVENVGQPPRQVVECDRRRQQRVEPRIGEQSERGGEPARDASSAARCDGATWPTWLETSRRRRLWNGAAERHRHLRRRRTSSVPARSPRSPASASAVASPAAVPLAWTTRSQSPGAASGVAKATPSAPRQLRARRIDIDQRHLGAGKSAAQTGDQRADHAGADDGDAVGRPGRGVPDRR